MLVLKLLFKLNDAVGIRATSMRADMLETERFLHTGKTGPGLRAVAEEA